MAFCKDFASATIYKHGEDERAPGSLILRVPWLHPNDDQVLRGPNGTFDLKHACRIYRETKILECLDENSQADLRNGIWAFNTNLFAKNEIGDYIQDPPGTSANTVYVPDTEAEWRSNFDPDAQLHKHSTSTAKKAEHDTNAKIEEMKKSIAELQAVRPRQRRWET